VKRNDKSGRLEWLSALCLHAQGIRNELIVIDPQVIYPKKISACDANDPVYE